MTHHHKDASGRGSNLCVAALLLLTTFSTAAQGFGPPLDREKLEAEAEAVAGLREQMGDDGFVNYAIGELDHLADRLPGHHPRYARRMMERGTPEQLWSIHPLRYWALVSELKDVGDDRAVEVLGDLLALRQLERGGSLADYFGRMFTDRIADAYLHLRLKRGEPLEALLDYVDRFGSDGHVGQYLVRGKELYGGSYPPEALEAFTRKYTRLAVRNPPAAHQITGAGGRELGHELETLQAMVEEDSWSLRLMALMIIARNPSLLRDEMAWPDDEAAMAWFEQAVVDEWEAMLTHWRDAPEVELGLQATRLAWLGTIIRARPRERFRPLVVESMRYTPSLGCQMLRESDLTATEGWQLIATLDDLSVPPRTQAAIISLLVEHDHRPAAPQVEAFIERYRLNAIDRHDRDANPERYPRLGIDSSHVLQWTEWLEETEADGGR